MGFWKASDHEHSGTIGWVVADNGRCRGQPLWTTAEAVVQSLLEGRPVARPWE